MAVEDAVDPTLNPAFERVEDGGGDQNGGHQAPLAHRFRHSVVNYNRNERDGPVGSSENQAGGQGVGYAALEDQVGIHQPVAHNGPTEGEGEKDERQASQLGN